jgi:hypothetical protein
VLFTYRFVHIFANRYTATILQITVPTKLGMYLATFKFAFFFVFLGLCRVAVR